LNQIGTIEELMRTRKLSIQLYLAHVGEKYKKTYLKQTNASTPLVQVQIREGSPEGNEWRKGFVKEMSFKSGVKGRGSDRCESEGGYWIWIINNCQSSGGYFGNGIL